MARKLVSVGEVFLIPAGTHRFVPAKVLFVEARIKGVILVALYASVVKTKSEPIELPESFDRLLYTTQEPILCGNWPSVGIHELRQNETGRTERLIGNAVWIENEKIRIATDEELSKIPSMDVCNSNWIEEDAQEIVAKLSP